MKKFLKSPWTVGIGTAVIGGILLSVILDLINKVSILSTMQIVLKFVWNLIISFLNFNIKVWWLIIAIAVIIAILWIVARFYDAKEIDKSKSFLSYTSDYLAGYLWEWVWEKNWMEKYEVRHLRPICTKCKTPLVSARNYRGDLKCPRCNDIVHFDSSKENEAMVLIYDNSRKNYPNN